MNTVFNTERLYLREFTLLDADKMYELNNDPEVLTFTGDEPFPSVEAARIFLEAYSHYQNHGYGRWAVITKENDEWIGWCGLKYHDEGYVDIGFRFFQKHWGKGYASEAALASLAYGRNKLKLPVIVGRVAAENIASVRVLEKIGLKYFKKDVCNGIENARYYK